MHDIISRFGIEGADATFPTLHLLHLQLLDSFAIDRGQPKELIDQALWYPLTVGWLFGQIENESGLAKIGMKEATFWVSMETLWVLSKEEETQFDDESLFSMWAAYYVSRTGPRLQSWCHATCHSLLARKSSSS